MNIYVSNLSFQVSDADLQELFSSYGTVSSAKVINDHASGRSRGFGFVEMPDREEALKAMDELNNSVFDGKEISVNEAKPKTDRPRGNDSGYNRGGGDRGGYRSDNRNKSW